MDDNEILDAYSRTVVDVAESVLPSVASVSVRTSRGGGSGSASVITADGFLTRDGLTVYEMRDFTLRVGASS